MVISFPQRLQPYAHGAYLPIDSSICREFEGIERTGDFGEFFSKYYFFPIEEYEQFNGEAPMDEADYFAVRDVLYTMFKLRELVTKNDEPTIEELDELGVSLPRKLVDDGREMVHPALNLGEIKGTLYNWFLGKRVRVDDRGFLENGFATYRSVSGEFFIMPQVGFYADSEFTSRDLARLVLDELCACHTRDLSMGYENGLPYQRHKSGISALWLSYCYEFSHVRVASCAACGKPILISGERGSKRLYCDNTCRKWANRNPSKQRAMRIRH